MHEAYVPLHPLPAALSLGSFGKPSFLRWSLPALLPLRPWPLEASSHHKTSFSSTLLLLSLLTVALHHLSKDVFHRNVCLVILFKLCFSFSKFFFINLPEKISNQILLSYQFYKVTASLLPAVVFCLFTIPFENKCVTVGANSQSAVVADFLCLLRWRNSRSEKHS